MDVSDASEHDSVMIALLPAMADWCRIELPHMTLVYAGLKDSLGPGAFNSLAKDAAMLATLGRSFRVKNLGQELFGPNRDTEVFRIFASSELLAMRRAVESWNASEFPFNPHVTIGPAGTQVFNPPEYIGFDQILVAWGDEQLRFWFKE